MDFSQFHFAQGAWLWGLLAIPAMPLVYALFFKTDGAKLLERFADRHLLPHLVRSRGAAGGNIRSQFLLWSMAWLCGVLAMAGPRWSYTDQQTFRVTQDLVVVLDLSQTMNATDVKPSRIVRAREEIEDLLDMSRGTSIGLVAYAAVPHMVTPLTDDLRTIRNLLPALDTALVTIQGDRLKPALEMAASMLKAEPGDDKSILVIGDGGFQEKDFSALARAAGNAAIYTMGVGTAAGTLVVGNDGQPLRDATGQPLTSFLHADRLQMLAAAGHGLYVEASYTDSDTRAILGRVEAANDGTAATRKSVRVWAERFYIPALALAVLLLPWFRRGVSFPIVVLFSMTFYAAGHAYAATASDLFLNQEQKARAAFERGDYKSAMKEFDTPYRRGVAAYRAGAYSKAAILFKIAAAQKGGLDALYDLGNAQLMQGQAKDAVASYEAVLKRNPGHVGARHNLGIAFEMLAQDRQQKQKKQPPNRKDKDTPQNGQKDPRQAQPHDKGGKQDGQELQAAKPQAAQPKDDRQAKQQQGQQQTRSRPTPPQAERYGVTGAAFRRPQRDVTADEWLGRVQSDPGSFLKNQFMIEERKSGLKQGARP